MELNVENGRRGQGVPVWANEVISFLKRNMPSDKHGYEHLSCTAYEIGCQALAKLGQVRETDRGAVPIEDPTLPETLPRWDDLCLSVLYLANQQNQIYYVDEGALSDRGATDVDAKPHLHGEISPANGLGAAVAEPEVFSVLEVLGLVANGRWASAAETVLWRESPREWNLNFTKDQRFIDAAEDAAASIPNDVRAKMDELVIISQKTLDQWIAGTVARYEEDLAIRGKPNRFLRPDTMEQALRRHQSTQRWSLDWLFFSGWRLDGGWLSPAEAERALDIFHDPVAISMRAAVMERAYPQVEWAAIAA